MENKVYTYFISGHRNITQEEFNENYGTELKKLLNIPCTRGIRFIVGDYYGVDIMAQHYLIDELNFPPEGICVYHMFDKPRNIHPLIENRVGGFSSDEERDAAMTRDSDFDIAFVRDHNNWSGTGANILRRHLLKIK